MVALVVQAVYPGLSEHHKVREDWYVVVKPCSSDGEGGRHGVEVLLGEQPHQRRALGIAGEDAALAVAADRAIDREAAAAGAAAGATRPRQAQEPRRLAVHPEAVAVLGDVDLA